MAEPGRPTDRNEPPHSRLSLILIVVLLILAVVGAILLFTVIKPNPNGTATGVVKTFLTDLQRGDNAAADGLRCDSERQARPGAARIVEQLGTTEKAITGFSVSEEGSAQMGSREGTAVAATIRSTRHTTDVDFFVVRENDKLRVCGIGSLAPALGG